jgi:membrane protease YdiL (CAAX protease family)
VNRLKEWHIWRAIAPKISQRVSERLPGAAELGGHETRLTVTGFGRAWILVLAYLGSVAGSELITVLVSTVAGMICHVILLVALLGSSALVGGHYYRKTCLVLALAPLIRVISLAIPVERVNYVYQYLIISVLLLLAVLYIIRILDLRSSEVGLKLGRIDIQVLVALTGIGFGLVEYHILKLEPLVTSLTWQVVLPAASVFLVVGFILELTFRGVMQHWLMETMGSWGWVCVAAVFSMLQIGYLSAVHVFLVLFIGLFYGWAVKRTGSLLGVTLSHGLTNIALFVIIPLLASR